MQGPVHNSAPLVVCLCLVAVSGCAEMYDNTRDLVATRIPADYYAQHVLGLSLFGLHRYDEAETRFKRAVELKPDFAESHFELGLKQARASFRRVLEIGPQQACFENSRQDNGIR